MKMPEQKPNLFRKKSLDRISQPDQLNDYLRVTEPMIWLLLVSILVVLGGLLVWSLVDTVDMTADGNALVSDGQAVIMLEDNEKYRLDEGMKVIIDKKETTISRIENNEFGMSVGYAKTMESDGTYPVSVIVRSAHPFELLFGVKLYE